MATLVVGTARERGDLVPVEAGIGEGVDHQLHVAFEQFGLFLEARTVMHSKAGARLGLKLVGRDMVGSEFLQRGEIAPEIALTLAGNAVDQVQR